tara:strand:+ start:391 stop:561 length:171 start_codon:yes stop_codon:yes gene_type:complete
MKNYNLEEIEPVFKECEEFFSNLVRVYKLQGIAIPDSLKSVREKVNKQIKQIEGEE